MAKQQNPQHNPQHNTQTPPAPAPLSSPDGSRCARDGRSGTLGCPYLPSSSTGRRRAWQSRPQPAGRAALPWAPGHSGLTWGGWRQGKRSGAVCLPPQRLALCSCSPLPTVGWGHEARTPAQSPTWVSAAASPPKKTSLECPHEPPGVKTLQLRAPPPCPVVPMAHPAAVVLVLLAVERISMVASESQGEGVVAGFAGTARTDASGVVLGGAGVPHVPPAGGEHLPVPCPALAPAPPAFPRDVPSLQLPVERNLFGCQGLRLSQGCRAWFCPFSSPKSSDFAAPTCFGL